MNPVSGHKAKLFLSLLFLLFSLISSGQEKKDFRLSLGTGFNTINDRIYYSPFIEGEYFLAHNWSLNYSLGYGRSDRGDVAFHFPLGWLAVPFACDPEAIVVCAMIPEGVSYHAYPNEKMEVAPFINLLQAQCVLSQENMLNVLAGAGVKLYYKPFDRFSVIMQYSLSVPYNRPDLYLNAGVSMGVLF